MGRPGRAPARHRHRTHEGSIRSGERRAEPGVTVIRVPPAAPRPTFEGALVVEGRRSTVWASAPTAQAIVVVDEHDEGLQEERAPTWHARDVAVERARRAGIPCVLAVAVSVARRAGRRRPRGRAVTRTRNGPVGRSSTSSTAGVTIPAPASTRIVLLQAIRRRARAGGLRAQPQGSLAAAGVRGVRSGRDVRACDAAVVQPATVLRCERCGTERPVLCTACGSTKLRNLRVGVGRVREELEAILGSRSATRTAGSACSSAPRRCCTGRPRRRRGRVPRLRPGAAVAALPRPRAGDGAARAGPPGCSAPRARGAGSSRRPGTRSIAVLDAVLHADPGRLVAPERAAGSSSGSRPRPRWPRCPARARREFIESFGSPLGVDVLGPVDGRWLLRAPTTGRCATPSPPPPARRENPHRGRPPPRLANVDGRGP